MGMIITKDNFEQEVLQADRPVLIDFWAEWCMPCQMVLPVIEEIEKEVDAVKVCKINVDEEMELARKFRVMSIPTLLLVKDGREEKRSVGALGKEEILEFISQT